MNFNQWGIILDSNNLTPGPVNTGGKLFRDTGSLQFSVNYFLVLLVTFLIGRPRHLKQNNTVNLLVCLRS